MDHRSLIDENGSPQFEMPMTDLLIHAEVHLPQGEEMRAAKVQKQSWNEDGEIVGTYDENPILNTSAPAMFYSWLEAEHLVEGWN